LTVKTSDKFKGESGLVTIFAPFPALDYVELPFIFVAVILAKTLDPQERLYGDDLRAATGIVQVLEDNTVEEIGLQYTDSVVYVKLSLCLI
jgi:hypothetical protein